MPRMLEQSGMLAALYTDSSSRSLLGRFARLCGKRSPASVRRLANRTIRGIPADKIYSSDAYNLHELGQKLLRTQKQGFELFRQRDRILSRRMAKWGTQEANVLYTMYDENLDFIRWAKDQGLRSVVDVYISPMTNQVMDREYASFQDWGGTLSADESRMEAELWSQVAQRADMLICPSTWVADGVRALTPEAAGKIKIVPYGCSIDYDGRTNRPVKGRILFAGGDALRKGLRYLTQAISQLKPSMPELELRVAGRLPDDVVLHPLCKDVHFLGKLTTLEMQTEFLAADAFVLPSLSEGFAGVVAEAIGAGCPVIVTEESGSPVVNGREGIIVPSRNIEALADAIKRMVVEPAFRQQCSEECLAQAAFYSESVWQKRLVEAIEEAGWE